MASLDSLSLETPDQAEQRIKRVEGGNQENPVATKEQQEARDLKFSVSVSQEKSSLENSERIEELTKNLSTPSTPRDSNSLEGSLAKIPNNPENRNTAESVSPSQLVESSALLRRTFGVDVDAMSSSDVLSAIENKKARDLHVNSNIKVSSLAVGSLGVLGGLMAPAMIGLSPGLAASLPAFMTTAVTVAGVSVASSVLAVSGIGLGIAGAGYGLYKMRNFFSARKNEKLRKAAEAKELDDLL